MSAPYVTIGTTAAAATTIPSYATDAAFESAKGSAGGDGDRYYNSTVEKYRYNENGVWTTVVTNLAYVAKSANYTALVTDRLIAADTGSAWTLTLPTAVGFTGLVFEVIKTTSDFNTLTLDGNASETINGSTTTTLNTQYEYIRIVSNGANWLIAERRIPSIWTAYTPTGAWVANTTYTGFWKRIGDSICLDVKVAASGAPTSATLTVGTPSGVLFDTAKLTQADNNKHLGVATLWDNSTTTVYTAFPVYNSTSTLVVNIQDDAAAGVIEGAITQANPLTIAANDYVAIRTEPIPVSTWNG